nr:8329_t:CDS:2 [Entrophospora candida]CAG8516937.1 4691_t:CDS:2 [Entrophospora candida]
MCNVLSLDPEHMPPPAPSEARPTTSSERKVSVAVNNEDDERFYTEYAFNDTRENLASNRNIRKICNKKTKP